MTRDELELENATDIESCLNRTELLNADLAYGRLMLVRDIIRFPFTDAPAVTSEEEEDEPPEEVKDKLKRRIDFELTKASSEIQSLRFDFPEQTAKLVDSISEMGDVIRAAESLATVRGGDIFDAFRELFDEMNRILIPVVKLRAEAVFGCLTELQEERF